jgi:hypothetical protein
MMGCWVRPGGPQQFIASVRESRLSAADLAHLLDAVPPTRTGTTGDACRYLADALERLHHERSNQSYDGASKQIVFISCGQYTGPEKALGIQIANLVKELTPFEPYFAEQVSDLDGLTRNIFAKLNEAVGFICVLHHRGEVKTLDGDLIRASVWIEQEIAIAAFIHQILGHRLLVEAFAKRGLSFEGIRRQVLLNPKWFDSEAEVISQLRSALPTWAPSEGIRPRRRVVPEIRVDPVAGGPSPRYRVSVRLQNTGTEPISDFRVEIRLPRGLVPDQTGLADEDGRISTSEYRAVVRRNHGYARELPLYPGAGLEVLSMEYVVNEATWLQRAVLSSRSLTVTVHSGDIEPQSQSRTFGELGLDEFHPEPIEVTDPLCRDNRHVLEVIEANARVGVTLQWRREAEVKAVNLDGAPYVLIGGRRVLTFAHLNKGDRELPPEYLVYP